MSDSAPSENTSPLPPRMSAENVPKPPQWKRWRPWAAGVVVFLIICGIIGALDDDEEGRGSGGDNTIDVVVMNKTVNTASARNGVKTLLDELNREYNGSLQVLGGMGDAQDRRVEAVVGFQKNGLMYTGLIQSQVDANGCQVRLQAAPQGQMAQVLGGGASSSGGGGMVAKLSPHRLPDGSGSINLPQGWRVTEATKGAVAAAGPDGDFVEIGFSAQMVTQPVMGMTPPNMAPWGPAPQMFPIATQRLWNLAAQGGGPQRQFQQVVEAQTLPGPSNRQDTLLVYDSTLNGRTYRSLALFLAQPTGPTSWMYYASSVSAPKERFNKDLPTLMAIWGSRRVDPRVTFERLQDAASKLRSCADIAAGVAARRSRVFDRTNEDWTEYFREQTFVFDRRNEELGEESYHGLKKLVEERNRVEGYNRFVIIPRRDIFRP